MLRLMFTLTIVLPFLTLTPVAAQQQLSPAPYWATAWRDNGFQAFNCYEREINGKGWGRPQTIYLNEINRLVGEDWQFPDKVKAYDLGLNGRLKSIVWEKEFEPEADGQTWQFYYFSVTDLTLQIIVLKYRVEKRRDYENLGLTVIDDRSWSDYEICEQL